ncbi:MAG: NUDIX hydrolase [Deltaproteobacteria bacterium]|nr:MAG: NUDIX hydrolase [Deltaproteobacteria bacterium]TMQ10869.1 MAG: NUDIX hydrolase [Deltaproteobacteria bacterium]
MTEPTKFPPQQGFAWRGNWQERLYALVRKHGYASVTDYANSRPQATLLELANGLGPGDVAPVQIESRLVAEAQASGTMEQCARSLLARALRDALPEGWQREWHDIPGDPNTPTFRKVGALSSLTAALPDAYELAIERVREALDAAGIPAGWLPTGPDDEILIEVFRQQWDGP